MQEIHIPSINASEKCLLFFASRALEGSINQSQAPSQSRVKNHIKLHAPSNRNPAKVRFEALKPSLRLLSYR